MRLDFLKERIDIPSGKRPLIVLNSLYGSRLKEAYPDSGWVVIVPGIRAEKALTIPYDKKILFINGGVPVAVLFRHKPL